MENKRNDFAKKGAKLVGRTSLDKGNPRLNAVSNLLSAYAGKPTWGSDLSHISGLEASKVVSAADMSLTKTNSLER